MVLGTAPPVSAVARRPAGCSGEVESVTGCLGGGECGCQIIAVTGGGWLFFFWSFFFELI